MNEVDAAFFISNASYLRAVSAVAAGFVVDRLSASKVIGWLFGGLIVSYLILSFFTPNSSTILIIYSNIIITFIAVYGLRGVYFALLGETKISGKITGTAVGLISVIGYTPDAFFNSLAGRILDASPGLGGHQNYFIFLAAIAVSGILITGWLIWLNKRQNGVE